MTREQAQFIRFLLICAAWAVGQMLTTGLPIEFADVLVPAALAIGVYAVTNDLGRARVGRGEAKYWRGQRVDDDRRRGRWN